MKIEEVVAKVGEDRIRKAMESDEADALKGLLDEEGISLTDEQLDCIAGGLLMTTTRTGPVIRPPQPRPTGGGSDGYIDTDDPTSPNWTADDPSDFDLTSTV